MSPDPNCPDCGGSGMSALISMPSVRATCKCLIRQQTPLAQALDPRLKPATMAKDEAASRLSNLVYEATELFERLEGAGLIRGNGHHMRQKVAKFATDLLEERWVGPSDPDEN